MLSRGDLTDNDYRDIKNKLPVLDDIYARVLSLSPDLSSMKFAPDSMVPVASVCLRDATDTLADAKFALRESFAHKIWYQSLTDKSEEWVGLHLGRFFAEDVALRLYSAGEHLANAITCMLGITNKDLDKYKKNNRSSKQVLVGHYLLGENPADQITEAIRKLVGSKEWLKTLNYRNDWVHNQPPTLGGVGIVYERRKRWSEIDSGRTLSFGGGDKPKYSLDGLLAFIQPASVLFAEVLMEIVGIYIALLTPVGIILDADGKLTVSM